MSDLPPIDKSTYAKWRENAMQSGEGSDIRADFMRLKKRHELETSEPLYAALVSARWAQESVWGDWSGISMTLQPFLQNPHIEKKWRASKKSREMLDSMYESCKRLHDLGKECDARVEKAEAAWKVREEEIRRTNPERLP